MGGSSFDLITQELLKQKQLMDQMEEENRELRHQLSDLRHGRGIFLEIDGRRFALVGELTTPPPGDTPIETALVAPSPVASITTPIQEPVEELDEVPQPTGELKTDASEAPQPVIAASEEEEKAPAPTFLEEVMLDEFASAATSPLAVWKGTPPETAKKPEEINEEEKAALRRQLIGSFLLE